MCDARGGSLDAGAFGGYITRMKGRLILGVPVVAAFALLGVMGAGVYAHAWFEERDTVAHHQRAREEAAKENGAIDLAAPPHPNSKLALAQQRLASLGQQLLLSLGMGAFFGALTFLGYRKLKHWPR